MTNDRLRASLPVDTPYYQAPPFFWRDARSLSVIYQTDADTAADLLPEGIELSTQAELIQVPSTDRKTHEAWLGPATLQYDAASDLDPWHRLPVLPVLPVRQVLGGIYTRPDSTLPYARVLRRY